MNPPLSNEAIKCQEMMMEDYNENIKIPFNGVLTKEILKKFVIFEKVYYKRKLRRLKGNFYNIVKKDYDILNNAVNKHVKDEIKNKPEMYDMLLTLYFSSRKTDRFLYFEDFTDIPSITQIIIMINNNTIEKNEKLMDFLQYFVASKNTEFIKLKGDELIKGVVTDIQYMLVDGPGKKNDEFEKIKNNNKELLQYAFHTSKLERWYSITQGGIRLPQKSGDRSGAGTTYNAIYVGQSSGENMDFLGRFGWPGKLWKNSEVFKDYDSKKMYPDLYYGKNEYTNKPFHHIIPSSTYSVLGLVEVITRPNVHTKKPFTKEEWYGNISDDNIAKPGTTYKHMQYRHPQEYTIFDEDSIHLRVLLFFPVVDNNVFGQYYLSKKFEENIRMKKGINVPDYKLIKQRFDKEKEITGKKRLRDDESIKFISDENPNKKLKIINEQIKSSMKYIKLDDILLIN